MPRIRGLREAAFWVLAGLSLILLLALLSYSPVDPAFSVAGGDEVVTNRMGPAGAWFADVAFLLFGASALPVPDTRADRRRVPVSRRGAARESGRDLARRRLPARHRDELGARDAAFPIAAICARPRAASSARSSATVSSTGSVCSARRCCCSCCGSRPCSSRPASRGSRSWIAPAASCIAASLRCNDWLGDARIWWEGRRAKQQRDEVVSKVRAKPKTAAPRIEPVIEKIEVSARASERLERERQVPMFEPPQSNELPALSLLDNPPPKEGGYSAEALEAMSRLVELKLNDFGVEAEVVAVHPGPVVTRFELKPAAGRQEQPDQQSREGSCALARDRQRARRRNHPGQAVRRPRDSERGPRDRRARRDRQVAGVRRAQVAADAGARQGHRRSADGAPTSRACRIC